jgi:hypothetical protein
MNRPFKLALAVAAAGLLALPVVAKLQDMLEDVTMACDEDVPKVCSSDSTGDHVGCLASHFDALSMGCQDFLNKFMGRYPCYADMERVCPDQTPGTHEAMECIRGQWDSLSEVDPGGLTGRFKSSLLDNIENCI